MIHPKEGLVWRKYISDLLFLLLLLLWKNKRKEGFGIRKELVISNSIVIVNKDW
jgi:hypothetical protein